MDLIPRLIEWLPAYGPWLIFVLAILETCFITGLVVPSGLATSVATVLALEGAVTLTPFVLAAAAGGFVGDGVGFWIGRATCHQLEAGDGRAARLFQAHRRRGSRFLDRHPIFSVTAARLVSFVRTAMPMAAGMSGLRFARYLVYEIPGLLGWVAIYVGIGFLAGESWELAVQAVGLVGTVLFAGVALVLWVAMRRGTSGEEEAGDATEADATGEAAC